MKFNSNQELRQYAHIAMESIDSVQIDEGDVVFVSNNDFRSVYRSARFLLSVCACVSCVKRIRALSSWDSSDAFVMNDVWMVPTVGPQWIEDAKVVRQGRLELLGGDQ